MDNSNKNIIPVVWTTFTGLASDILRRGYWDQAILEDLFKENIWKPSGNYEFDHYGSFKDLPENTGCILIIPARHNADKITKINNYIAKLPWVLLILCGDEEAVFPTHKLKHPRMKIWLQTPHMNKNQVFDRLLINGYAPDTNLMLKEIFGEDAPTKDSRFFFSGQVTHKQRRELFENIEKLEGGVANATKGFTQGLDKTTYLIHLASAVVAPCPSGAVIPDSFRVYEALEAGCVPLLDGKSSKEDVETNGYWQYLFNDDELPIPVIEDWNDVEGHINFHNDVYPQTANKIFAWWQVYKRNLAYNLLDDLMYLTETKPELSTNDEKITVLIPTSPIQAHPSTDAIEETIQTVRHHFPNSEIIIMFDGVREEQKGYKERYEEYKRQMLWKCNYKYKNVMPLVFEEHQHQANMTKTALKYVRTPFILFVEHDAPIVTDEITDWNGLINLLETNEANVIRLHHEALVLKEHQLLMVDKQPIEVRGVPIVRTAQWSQRPHLASAEFYRWMLTEYFSKDSRTMIEDRVHGFVISAFMKGALRGWNEFKVVIYAPDGNMKRSYHIDSRGSDSKFEDRFIY